MPSRTGTSGDSDGRVHLIDAFWVACPHCSRSQVYTPSRREAEESAAAHLDSPPLYAEPVPVGGKKDVYFLTCPGCGKGYVARMVVVNGAEIEQWHKVVKKYNPGKMWRPGIPDPLPKLKWKGGTFREWMLEVAATPNAFLQMKARRECEKRGVFLPWEAVINEALRSAPSAEDSAQESGSR